MIGMCLFIKFRIYNFFCMKLYNILETKVNIKITKSIIFIIPLLLHHIHLSKL
jgi:hypothetical protein